MTYGAYAGVLGAGLGALMGVAAGIIQLRIVYPGWPADIPWLTVARTCDVALGGAVLCSAVPAWLAARAPLSTGTAGGASDRIVRWPPWMAVGPSALAILVVFAVIVRTAPAVAAMAAVSMCVTTVGMLYSAEAQRAVAEVRLIHPHPTVMVNAGQDVTDTTVQSLRDIKEPSATYQVYSAEQAESDVGSRYGAAPESPWRAAAAAKKSLAALRRPTPIRWCGATPPAGAPIVTSRPPRNVPSRWRPAVWATTSPR